MAAKDMQSHEDVPLLPKDPKEMVKLCRREFTLMTWTLAINHATVTTPIIYASSVLTDYTGQLSNAVLYFSTLVFSLFFAAPLLAVLGARRGLALAMGLYSIYVFFFALASSMCAHFDKSEICEAGEPGQMPTALLGAVIGGLGAGLLWTCQGAFFVSVCERLSEAEQREKSEVTAELASSFAFTFLAAESVLRALVTLLTTYAGLGFSVAFFFFAGIAVVATGTFMILSTADLKKTEPLQAGQIFDKALSAVRLWSDPRLWALQCTNLAFGFAVAWMAGYVGRHILSKALSSTFIGFAGAILSALASILSMMLGPAAVKFGKGPVLALGSASFIALGLLSLLADADWGWGTLIFYVLMGIGRAVYESTNKAIFADTFPGEKSAGAFANVFAAGTGASTIAFVLGAKNMAMPEMYLMVIFATLTLPGYMLATGKALSETS